MSSIPQTTDNGNSVSDFSTNFMKMFHLGKLLFNCNAGKEKGIPVMDVFRFLFCMMFSDRSFYMQMKIGTFGESFSKNTIYRFLNNARTNWQCFTTLLSSGIVNGFIKPLTDAPFPEGDACKHAAKRQMSWWNCSIPPGMQASLPDVAYLTAGFPPQRP